ncbi:restriction endonuclease subunit S [Iodobacter ciconiae]|uniref:Restriction endonuclease subunit S n=2 Tax=Iodobacter ciconiae TaxID=2496266 RepID=A0A3S8ZX40_9NEIS|nr:restriction endonuclease subunit S [Iodobacter ciconiae]
MKDKFNGNPEFSIHNLEFIINTPAIRFKGFSGEWEVISFASISESFDYGLNAAAKEYDGKNKYIRITDIKEDTRVFDHGGVTSPNTDLTAADNYRLKYGDILFARTGASVGKTYIYREQDGLVYFAGFLIRARIKESVNAEFIFQSTLTEKYNKFIRLTSQRSGQPGVNALEYGAYEVFLPQPKEQTQIGNYFQQLDTLIAQHQQKHDKLLNLKKALLEKMFPKQGKKEPEIRFKGFSGEWEDLELCQIVDVRSGRDYKHLSSGDIPVFGTGGYMLSVNQALSYNENAIGIGRKGTIDKPYILKAPFWTVDTLFYAVPYAKNNLDFIYATFQKINWRQKDESTGVPSLSKVSINSISVFTTEETEQTKVGNLFTNIDTLINQHQAQLKKLNNIKQACLEKMFV